MSNKPSKKPWFVASIIMITILLILEKNNLTEILHYPTSYILRIAHTTTKPIKQLTKKMQSWNYLHKRCLNLEQTNDELVEENVALRSLLHKQEKSKLLTAFESRYRHTPNSMAKILSTEISPTGHYCIVDKGKNDGIEEEMYAVHKTQLLGKVTKVYPTHSKVLLITDKNCKVSVFIAGANQHGICEGTNKQNLCRIRFIEDPKSLTLGSMVITNGKGVIFPEGFLIGFLTQTTPDAPDSPGEWLIEAKPRLAANTLEFCHLSKGFNH